MKTKYLFIYFIFILLAYADTSSPESSITLEQKNKIEELTKDIFTAPDFELNSVNQEKYKLSNLKGKVVILNFESSQSRYFEM